MVLEEILKNDNHFHLICFDHLQFCHWQPRKPIVEFLIEVPCELMYYDHWYCFFNWKTMFPNISLSLETEMRGIRIRGPRLLWLWFPSFLFLNWVIYSETSSFNWRNMCISQLDQIIVSGALIVDTSPSQDPSWPPSLLRSLDLVLNRSMSSTPKSMVATRDQRRFFGEVDDDALLKSPEISWRTKVNGYRFKALAVDPTSISRPKRNIATVGSWYEPVVWWGGHSNFWCGLCKAKWEETIQKSSHISMAMNAWIQRPIWVN
jgi:hypothetical protein